MDPDAADAKRMIPRASVNTTARTKTSLACYNCRRKRTKCDGVKPVCGRCSSMSIACDYAVARRSRLKELEARVSGILAQEKAAGDSQTLPPVRPGARADASAAFPTLDDADLTALLFSQDPAALPKLEDLSSGLPGSLRLNTAAAGSSNPSETFPEHSLAGGRSHYSPESATTANISTVSSQSPSSSTQDDGQLMNHIYSLIRNGNPEEVLTLVNTIRQSRSLHEASSVLLRDVNSSQEHLPQLDSPLAAINIASFSEPLFRVSAEPWTTITSDDMFVSHLLSCYFTWENPHLQFIDRDLFLKDMGSGQTRFCSKFLVNAMLAQSCFYAYQLDQQWSRVVEMTIVKQFLGEALGLWQAETDELSLTSVQGSLILNHTLNCMGKDKLGSDFLLNAVGKMNNPAFHELYATLGGPDPASLDSWEWRKAYTVLTCGFLHWRTLSMHTMQSYLSIDTPRDVDLSLLNEPLLELWFPYPLRTPTHEVSHYGFLAEAYGLSNIAERVCRLLYRSGPTTTAFALVDRSKPLIDELTAWHDKLDAQFENTMHATPQAFMLLLFSASLKIDLCNFSLNDSQSSSNPASPYLRDRSLAQHAAYQAKLYRRELIEIYFNVHGWKSCCITLTHWLLLAALDAVEILTSHTSGDNFGIAGWQAFLSLCVDGLWHVSFAAPIGRFMLRCLQLRLNVMDAAGFTLTNALSTKALQTLEVFSKDVWPKETPHEIRSLYPISWPTHMQPKDGNGFLVPTLQPQTPRGGEDVTMEHLLRSFDTFGLDR